MLSGVASSPLIWSGLPWKPSETSTGSTGMSTSVDVVAKRVVQVTNSATSTMLEKASDEDIAGFRAYTIRSLDSKLSNEFDIEQYKVLRIRKDPLDNREKYLDVMCFPVLFPTRRFGEHHPRQVRLSHSEHVKSRLLNKDLRYRKEPQYVFYLLWQELREISAGVYNLLKSTRSRPMSVSALLHGVSTSDERLEANLSTMLQSVRDMKHTGSPCRASCAAWSMRGAHPLCFSPSAVPSTSLPTSRGISGRSTMSPHRTT